MNIPENCKYTENHEWVRVEGSEAFIGVTDFAQGELGDVVFVEVETEGEELDRKESFGTIEAVKTVADIYMPIAGEVLEFNPALEDEPNLVNKDAYGAGWLIKIAMTDESQLNDLLSPEEYKAKIS